MPACTGLPPGELINSTTAFEPSSSNAARSAALMNSALASAPSAISPLSATTAVCGVLTSLSGALRSSANQTSTPKKVSQDRRTKVRQRRVAFCSSNAAKASFSSVARSQPPPAATPESRADGLSGALGKSKEEGTLPG